MSGIVINPYIFAAGGGMLSPQSPLPGPSPQSPQGLPSPQGGGSPFEVSPETFLDYSLVNFHTFFNGNSASPDGSSSPPGIIDRSEFGHVPNNVAGTRLDTANARFGRASLQIAGSPNGVLTYPSVSPELAELGTRDFTIELWYKANSAPGTTGLMSRWVTGSVAWWLGWIGGNLRFTWSNDGASNAQWTEFSDAPVLDNWYHLLIHRDDTELRMFLNGVLQVTEDEIDSTDPVYAGNAPLAIGGLLLGSGSPQGASNQFDGWIDEVRITMDRPVYRKYVDESTSPQSGAFPVQTEEYWFDDVKFLTNFQGSDGRAGSPELYEESNLAQLITFGGNAVLDDAQARFGSTSVRLTAGPGISPEGGFVEVADNDEFDLLDNEFTIEAWIRFEEVNASSEVGACIASHYRSDGANERSWFWSLDGTTLGFFWSTNGISVVSATATWSPVVDQWYHVAVCRDNEGTDSVRMFVDGEELTVGGSSIAGSTLFQPTYPLQWGAVEGGTATFRRYVDGWLDECRLTVGRCLYKNNFEPRQRQFNRDWAKNDDGRWSPFELSGSVIAWFDPSDADSVTFAGSPTQSPSMVDTITDRFGGSVVLSRAGGDGPVLNEIKGRNALLYESQTATLWADLSPELSDPASDHSIFVVATRENPKSVNAGLVQYGATAGTWLDGAGHILAPNGTNRMTVSVAAYNVSTVNVGENSPVTFAGPAIFGFTYSDVTDRIDGYYNGNNEGNTTDSTALVTGGRLTVGNLFGDIAGWEDDHVCEVLILNYVPDQWERFAIEGYLAHKWLIAAKLPDNHPYKDAAP